MNEIVATLNQQPLLNLSINLRRGARPSEFVAVMPVQGAPHVDERVLVVLAEGGHRREFSQFTVSRVTDLGLGLCEVRGEDLRALWSRHEVRRSFNTPRGDGSILEPRSLDQGSPWTCARLMEELSRRWRCRRLPL